MVFRMFGMSVHGHMGLESRTLNWPLSGMLAWNHAKTQVESAAGEWALCTQGLVRPPHPPIAQDTVCASVLSFSFLAQHQRQISFVTFTTSGP